MCGIYLKDVMLATLTGSDGIQWYRYRCAMDQLTSSQQALPDYLLSQGLYALLLMRVGVGVRSLSARSFKVRHGMHRCGEVGSEYVPRCQNIIRIGSSNYRHDEWWRYEGSDKAETNKDRIYMITSEWGIPIESFDHHPLECFGRCAQWRKIERTFDWCVLKGCAVWRSCWITVQGSALHPDWLR